MRSRPDQTFDVRPSEIEMPRGWASDDLVPGADPWDGGIHHHPASDAIRMLRSEGVNHHVADIMGDKVGLLNIELVKNTPGVTSLCLLIIAIFGMRREAHPRKSGTTTT